MDFGLSVLDLSPVSSGSNGAQAIRNTLDLARLADRLGYERYWLAEHHNLPSVASFLRRTYRAIHVECWIETSENSPFHASGKSSLQRTFLSGWGRR
jgi:alkanesulfonate monooxygenase SsuD/methylene tetrahydromethanopterin reductase-like flavin-dependent oxidoreductase (luciferase family)